MNLSAELRYLAATYARSSREFLQSWEDHAGVLLMLDAAEDGCFGTCSSDLCTHTGGALRGFAHPVTGTRNSHLLQVFLHRLSCPMAGRCGTVVLHPLQSPSCADRLLPMQGDMAAGAGE